MEMDDKWLKRKHIITNKIFFESQRLQTRSIIQWLLGDWILMPDDSVQATAEMKIVKNININSREVKCHRK